MKVRTDGRRHGRERVERRTHRREFPSARGDPSHELGAGVRGRGVVDGWQPSARVRGPGDGG